MHLLQIQNVKRDMTKKVDVNHKILPIDIEPEIEPTNNENADEPPVVTDPEPSNLFN
jgi:hypothetical protein